MWFSRPPMYSQFVAVWRQEYVADVDDCSNKAGRYARCLRDVCRLPAQVLVMQTPAGTHAIVHVVSGGTDWYCDPTTGRCTHLRDDHGEMLRSVSEHDLYAGLEYR